MDDNYTMDPHESESGLFLGARDLDEQKKRKGDSDPADGGIDGDASDSDGTDGDATDSDGTDGDATDSDGGLDDSGDSDGTDGDSTDGGPRDRTT